MARVTVEDCIKIVDNRFELVMLAAQRARSLSSGAEITVDRDNDKNPVIALREIAEKNVEIHELEAGLVKGLQSMSGIRRARRGGDGLLPPAGFWRSTQSRRRSSLNQPVFQSIDGNGPPMPVFNDDVLPMDNNTLPSTE